MGQNKFCLLEINLGIGNEFEADIYSYFWVFVKEYIKLSTFSFYCFKPSIFLSTSVVSSLILKVMYHLLLSISLQVKVLPREE